MLAKKFRLKKTDAIPKLLRHGTPLKNDFLVLKFRKNNLSHPRVAVIITIKIIPKAFARNHLRRQIYTTLRHILKKNDFTLSYDLAILTRHKSTSAPYSQISTSLENLIKKIPSS